MSAPALAAPGGRALTIRGTSYPVLLPTLRDPRLHLAAVIFSLHALGQIAFHFRLSIVQIAIAIGTAAVLELVITFFSKHMIMWPASAMLTGNGVAFILRLPGTHHGDWWTAHGWYYYAGASAVSLLSKYLIKLDGRHIFNPSNFGLVLVFLIFREGRAEPLDFWWGPMDVWMIGALAIIVCGGVAILYRLRILLPIAVPFWLTFAAGIGVVAAAGHAMTARWHVGPVTGFEFWWIIATSPEVLVFTFFMLSDPKTIPSTTRGRIAYSVAVAIMATLLIAPARTEFWAKTGLLGALILACAGWPLLKRYARPRAVPRRTLALAGAGLVALFAGGLVAAGIPARPDPVAAPLQYTGRLPAVAIGKPDKGVFEKLDRKTAHRMAADLVADFELQTRALSERDTNALARAATFARLPELRRQVWAAAGNEIVVPAYRLEQMSVHYSLGQGQGAAVAVAKLEGTQQLTTYLGRPPHVLRRAEPTPFRQTIDLQLARGRWLVARIDGPHAVPKLAGPSPIVLAAARKKLAGVRLTDVARRVGLDFRQGAFRYGVTPDPPAFMGGGVCWLDYDDDGWMDLFVVNSYGEGDIGGYYENGGLPRSVLFHNDHGRFTKAWTAPATRGEGCVAADLNGDGRTDLFVTTAQSDLLFWNEGYGRWREGARAAGIASFGWHAGAAVADVNGDGHLDLYVAGYTEPQGAIEGSDAGYPTNHLGVRDELFLNEGNGHFREVGRQVGLDSPPFDHSLGAVFIDLNKDGRLDLYVADDEDPNHAYINEQGGPLGFHFVEQARRLGLADRNAGMGVAVGSFNYANFPDYLFVTNSRGQEHAVFRASCADEDCSLTDGRRLFAEAFGTNFTGWGDSFVDLANDGRPELVLANGDIPVKNLAKDAGRIQVMANASGNWLDAGGLLETSALPRVNGRGVAAADFDNDGHVDLAVSSVGGRLMLLRSSGGSGHWLEVNLKPFVPGAIVSVYTPKNLFAQEARAGSSYLSSEDPRLHFGLGPAKRIDELGVLLPGGRTIRLKNVRADQIVTVRT
jgi:Na+-translocating ferredoxin:NAD+ oxidoreductase RnfD subunit